MQTPWFFQIAWRDHEIQNAITTAKIRVLGEYLGLRPQSKVLDVGSGKGGPALALAEAFRCRITGVEREPEFVSEAQKRARDRGLHELVEFVEADAATFDLGENEWDAALCIGAPFIFGGLGGTAAALAPAVREGGRVAVGEYFWRVWPLPDRVDDQGFRNLSETVARLEAVGLRLGGYVAASQDDLDHFESLHWRALEEWLAANPDHPNAREFQSRHDQTRARYLETERELLGWAIFVGWKRPD